MRKRRKILVILTALALIFTFTCGDVMALSFHQVKGDCLAKYKLKKYKIVKNPSWNFVKKAGYKQWYNGEFTTNRYYISSKGHYAKFQRWLRIDLDNPQAVAITPDGNTMFIMTTHKKQKKGTPEYGRKGYIFKINIKGIKADAYVKKQLKKKKAIYVDIGDVNCSYRAPAPPVYDWFDKMTGKSLEEVQEAEMEKDRKTAKEAVEKSLPDEEKQDYDFDSYVDGYFDPDGNWHNYLDFDDDSKVYNHDSNDEKWLKANGFDVKEDPENDNDYIYRKYITRSNELVTGHGQAMAYNPKTRKLWYMPNMKHKKCRAIMVNPNTMKPEGGVDFKFKSNIQCPSTLAFDKYGNAYCYARTTKKKKKVPKSVAKIYKGTLSLTNPRFQLVMQGLRWTPGTTPQSLGYNPKSDRLYLVSDRSIVSIPATKIRNASKPSLTPSDVRATRWSFSKEFEGITFDNTGNGYFLTNKPDEVMLVNKGF